jgi:hypothetical protein
VNDIATVDAAIGTLRKALTRRTATPGAGNWAQELEAATRALNESPHGHLDGEALADATGNSEAAKSLRFDLKGNAAEDAATQDLVTRRKRERLEKVGAFREPVDSGLRGLPARGYKPRYETGARCPSRRTARPRAIRHARERRATRASSDGGGRPRRT